ncbi:hypothetical protein Psuf_050360 [Phytohabitans suffuscus]|uniref:Uncharacterized protein n=1 Tax=Phytohabitans suffuscus TaxID=624315 RepID=A0A6F8YP20_9ACTN|nr:hypothetical protein Psuf_050360 [Phytohabitans suffuscus]
MVPLGLLKHAVQVQQRLHRLGLEQPPLPTLASSEISELDTDVTCYEPERQTQILTQFPKPLTEPPRPQ